MYNSKSQSLELNTYHNKRFVHPGRTQSLKNN